MLYVYYVRAPTRPDVSCFGTGSRERFRFSSALRTLSFHLHLRLLQLQIPNTKMKLVLLLVMMPVLLAASVNLCNGPCRCYQVIAGVGAGSSVLNCDNAVIYKKLRLKDIIGFQHLNLRGAKFVADCGTFASPTLQAIDMRNAHSSSPVCALVRECPLVANKVGSLVSVFMYL